MVNYVVRAVTIILLCVAVAGCDASRQETLTLATTTSVHNSGLLANLLPAYQAASGVVVRVHAAGSGRALAMLANDQADVVISHAPEAERRMLDQHRDWSYRKIGYNQFVVVGPEEDPAGVGRAKDVIQAFRLMAQTPVKFVSRGDQSGTHEREETLWAAAGQKPSADRLLISGAGMAQALRHASELQAYTLSDAATFWQLEQNLSLQIVFENDPQLLNTYAILYPAADRGAQRFADWLTSERGRDVLGKFLIAGRPAYSPWPKDCPSLEPAHMPCSVTVPIH